MMRTARAAAVGSYPKSLRNPAFGRGVRAFGRRCHLCSECDENLGGSHDLGESDALVRHVNSLRLPGAEHDATRVVLRVVRHLRAVRDADDLRASEVSELPYVIRVKRDGSGRDLVEPFEIDALARCRERTSQERLDVG